MVELGFLVHTFFNLEEVLSKMRKGEIWHDNITQNAFGGIFSYFTEICTSVFIYAKLKVAPLMNECSRIFVHSKIHLCILRTFFIFH